MRPFAFISSGLDLTSPVPVGQEPLEYPFWEWEQTTFILSQKYRQLRSAYLPPTLDGAPSNHHYDGAVDVSAAKCIGDISLHLVEPDVVEFTRQWALVPQTRVEPESYLYNFPGLNQTPGYAILTKNGDPPLTLPDTLTSVDPTGSYDLTFAQIGNMLGFICTLTAGVCPFVAGQSVKLVFVALDGFVVSNATVFSVASGSFTLAWNEAYYNLPSSLPWMIMGNAVEIQPRPIEVQSFLTYDYFNTTDTSTIGTNAKFKVFDANGNLVNKVSPNTTPSYSTYAAAITAGSQFVAEDSTFRRWKGNIWERKTRRVTYQ